MIIFQQLAGRSLLVVKRIRTSLSCMTCMDLQLHIIFSVNASTPLFPTSVSKSKDFLGKTYRTHPETTTFNNANKSRGLSLHIQKFKIFAKNCWSSTHGDSHRGFLRNCGRKKLNVETLMRCHRRLIKILSILAHIHSILSYLLDHIN